MLDYCFILKLECSKAKIRPNFALLTPCKYGGAVDEVSELERSSIISAQAVLYFREMWSSIWNHNAPKTTKVESTGHISHLLTLEKFTGEVSEMFESILRVQPRTKPPIYFRRGVCRLSWKLEPTKNRKKGQRQNIRACWHTSGGLKKDSTQIAVHLRTSGGV